MRLLIVEDEENISSYLKASLEAEGFDVDVATDGLAGLELALTDRYDAVTLDVMLPGINGYKICHEIRQAGLDVPVLMLTARDGEREEAAALDIGADDFLRKPFSLAILKARLKSLLRRSGRTGAARGAARVGVLAIAGVELDPARRAVTREGKPVELTPREFSLLECLMRNEGLPVSKEDILAHVWGAGYEGDATLVEVYIGYLRKKIDAPFGRKSIRTVRGVGYRITDELAQA